MAGLDQSDQRLCPGLLLPAVAEEQSKVKALHGQAAAQQLPELKGSLKILLLKIFLPFPSSV